MCKNNTPIEKKVALKQHAKRRKEYIDSEYGQCEVYLHGDRETLVYLVVETGKYYTCFGETIVKEFSPDKEQLTLFITK